MGASLPGKVLFPLQIVETKFQTPFELKVVGLDCQVKDLAPFRDRICVFVNSGSKNPRSKEHIQALNKLKKDFPQVAVILVPSDQFGNQPGTFEQVRQRYKKMDWDGQLLGKQFLSGSYAGPLFKVLRRKCDLYDKLRTGAHTIKGDYNVFLVKGSNAKHFVSDPSLGRLRRDLESLLTLS